MAEQQPQQHCMYHDMFITDVEYDADEKFVGFVQTGTGDEAVGSKIVRLNYKASDD